MKTVDGVTAWKQVEVDLDTWGSNEAFQCLNSFEEVDEAEVEQILAKSAKKKVSKKKKNETQNTSSETEPVINEHKDDAKAKKGKKKKTKKGKVKKVEECPESPTSDDNVLGSDNGDDKSPKDSNATVKRKRKKVDEASWTVSVPEATTSTTEIDCSAWTELGVNEQLCSRLAALGYGSPTEIQKLVLPDALQSGRIDIVGAAETGSGKTLAYAIPIVQHLLQNSAEEGEKDKRIRALCLTPTRELAIQIKQHIRALLVGTKLNIAAVVGGLFIAKQKRILKKNPPDIIVATPGRLWELMQEPDTPELNDLASDLEFLVIDETDRMLEKGHFAEVQSILDRISSVDKKKPPSNEDVDMKQRQRQSFIFSATLTFTHELPSRLKLKAKKQSPNDKIDALAKTVGLRPGFKVVDITRKLGTAEGLTETRINCDNLEEKDLYLYYFLTKYPGRTIVFTNSVDCSRRLNSLLSTLKMDCFVLHAKMHQKQRFKNLERFASSSSCTLLATDVAARGLDIRNIQHVIHYQIPRTTEIYIHRSGRTARARNEGVSLMLVDAQDVRYYRKICVNLNKSRDLAIFPTDSFLLKRLRDHVRLATSVESAEHRARRQRSQEQWRKSMRSRGQLADDDEYGGPGWDSDEDEQPQQKKAKKDPNVVTMQSQLDGLLKGHNAMRRPASVSKYPTFYAQLCSMADNMPETALDAAKQHSKLLNQPVNIGGRIKMKRKKKFKQKRR